MKVVIIYALAMIYSLKKTKYPLERKLDGSQIFPGHCGEKKHSLPARNHTLVVQPVANHIND
jgi:hypothetical protein